MREAKGDVVSFPPLAHLPLPYLACPRGAVRSCHETRPGAPVVMGHDRSA
jgi:hypothetical protein